MTLSRRDEFAKAVFPAAYADWVANFENYSWSEDWREGLAKDACMAADALIAELDLTAKPDRVEVTAIEVFNAVVKGCNNANTVISPLVIDSIADEVIKLINGEVTHD